MLQPVLLKMPKTYAIKNNSNEPKCATLKKALFYAASKDFLFYFRARFLSENTPKNAVKVIKNTVKKNLEDRENP